MENMEDEEEKDVLIFDTRGGRNGTIKKYHGMCSNTKTINEIFVDTRIRLGVKYNL